MVYQTKMGEMGEIPGLFTRKANQQTHHTDVWVPVAPMEAVQPARPTNWHPRPMRASRCYVIVAFDTLEPLFGPPEI